MSSIDSTKPVMSRRAFVGGMAIGLAAASPAFASAPSILKGAGDFRALNVVNSHTSERLNCVYWIEGRYVPEALEAFNYILRDWREDLIKPIDPRTLDIMAATHGLLGCSEPFHIISGYRCPKTNAMLRSRSSRVAQNSYHIRGMAVDLSLRSRTVWEVANAARSLGGGGVGRYSRSNFTHVDSGPIREWGR
jgi:uncharacterized protein YcbK (DUF882 family)